ncbi:hypothetical protein CK203_079244 [Vitis vinifera]|uniref:Uncharacterized protein n=1 Tax=Vitis vinifera TaxID=29760 RepID=A0A438FBH3_VITVI|nr:hypothetical protein CK203_079244 [Vitis vinifera]
MDSRLENLSLSVDEEEEFVLDTGEDGSTTQSFDLCLIGRFLTNRMINFNAMKHRLASVWRLGKNSDGCEKQWRILRMQTIPGMVAANIAWITNFPTYTTKPTGSSHADGHVITSGGDNMGFKENGLEIVEDKKRRRAELFFSGHSNSMAIDSRERATVSQVAGAANKVLETSSTTDISLAGLVTRPSNSHDRH